MRSLKYHLSKVILLYARVIGFIMKIAKDILFCILSGVLLGFSQPFFMPELGDELGKWQYLLGTLALVGYVPYFLSVRTKSLKTVFWLTLLMMTIQYTIVLYWLYIAVHIHGNVAVIPALTITLLVPLILALKGCVFFTMARFISQRCSVSFFLIAAVALTSLEYFRNYYLFGGFPWGNVGYSLGRIDELLQLASLVGVYGLVFFAALINACICLAITAVSNKLRLIYAACACIMVLSVFFYGHYRLLEGSNNASFIKVALIQGNIPQEIKNSARLYASDILDIYEKLQTKAINEKPDLIIWPESSFPRTLKKEIKMLSPAPKANIASVIGATSYGYDENDHGHYHNSAFLIDYDGHVIKRYDKTHLVPFGEYVPWPMSGIVDKVVPGMGAFKPGNSFEPIYIPLNSEQKIPVGVTVCYEGIFPEITRAYAKNGARLLINLTNDAWYGFSSAPYQHLLMYRLRAVESGLSFVRATNSGLTAYIDTYGNIRRDLGLFERGIQINEVSLNKKNTIYAAVGDLLPLTCLISFILAFLLIAIPWRNILKEKKIADWVLIIVTTSTSILATVYYSKSAFLTNESAGTKKFFIVFLSLTVLIAALVRSQRSKSILFIVGALVLTISLALTFFESLYFLLGLILSVLIFLLALRIKNDNQG